MFSTYDLKAFSIRLKEIRKILGYTQEDVVSGTGLSTETLRKLEKGLTIPRYDTIEYLSRFYKMDLQSVLNNYKSSRELLKYYDLVDFYITGDYTLSISDTINEFNEFMKNENSKLIEIKELQQLELLFSGLDISFSDHTNHEIQWQAINIYIEAIHICNPTFHISNWNTFKYSYVELRILFAISSLYGFLRACTLSNEMLFYIINALDLSSFSKKYDKLLITKAYALLAYNFHRIDLHDEAIKYAQIGIDYCNKHSIMDNLPLLLLRKAVAMYYLNYDHYEDSIDYAIILLEIQGNHKASSDYEAQTKRYRKS